MDSKLTPVKIYLKPEHVNLLDLLMKEYGVSSKSKVLEMLLDDLLTPEPETPSE